MTENPILTIAVQNYRNPFMLSLCIDAIKKHVPQNLSHEIIVADSATQEDTHMVMREDYPEVTFYPHEKNVGFGKLVNACIKHSTGEYLFFVNADTIVTQGSIEKLLAFMKEHPDAGMCGPLQKNFNGRTEQTCFRFYRPWTILYRRTFLKNFPFAKKHLAWFTLSEYERAAARRVDWVIGSAMFVSRKAIKKVGLMDERFFMYMEDVDWCRRFWDAGCGVYYNPDVSVYHYYGKGSAKGGFFRALLFNRLTWHHIMSALRYFVKYVGKPLPQHKYS